MLGLEFVFRVRVCIRVRVEVRVRVRVRVWVRVVTARRSGGHVLVQGLRIGRERVVWCVTDRERGFLLRGVSAWEDLSDSDLTGVGPSFVFWLAYSVMGSNSSFSPPHRKAECKIVSYCSSAALRFPPSMSTDTNLDATKNNELSRSIIQVCSDHTSG